MTSELRLQRKALETLWQRGLSGHELLRQQTDLTDNFIIDLFNKAPAILSARGKIALVALGGYGRRELYPFSDVDLLLLHDRRAAKSMRDVAEAILYPLWDGGFEVGHSVRTPGEAISFARDDFCFQVALLDARLLAGSQSLFDNLRQRYRKKILDGRRREFARAMEEFRSERRKKYGSHSYLLEPHIKEGKGGMRDIQGMLWTGKAVFGLDGIAAMEESGMLEPRDCRAFEQSWDMLTRLRNRLHYISQRKNDQMFFEYQEEMATSFGYEDRDGLLAVEHFMRRVYAHLQTIAVITDLFFEHVQEVLGLTAGGRAERQLEKGIIARNASIRLTQPGELAERPYLLMRLFLQAGRTGLALHHRTRQAVTRNLGLVDDSFRSSLRISRIFFAVLMRSKDPMPVLEVMLETGLLTSYIPEFRGVESLAQHDLYHIYTVDRHQLQTVSETTRLHKLQPELFMGQASPHLVYLAALLHDIGKGHHTDHSVLGAKMIDGIAVRLGLKKEERQDLDFLVRYHLYLPENAMRRDLEDQEFIRAAAGLIGNTDRLTMLYLLTIADSKSTGPSAWSEWKAALLSELYLRVKSCLAASCVKTEDRAATGHAEEQGVSWLKAQVARLTADRQTKISVHDLPADYLMSFNPERVAYHLQIHDEKAARLQQQVLLFPEEARRGYWSLLVMSKDRPGLLAKLCGVLALHNLMVLAAHIFTWPDSTVVDVLDVAPVADTGFAEQDWQGLEQDINLALNYRLDVGSRLHRKMHTTGLRPGRQVQQLQKKVIVDNKTSERFTLVEVYCGDRPGTLYHLTQTLSDFGLDIHQARIATEVEQLIDIFYVTCGNGGKMVDPVRIDKVRKTLLHFIEKEAFPAG